MQTRLEAGSLVTVFGGSGFVGRHTVRALARDGWRIRAAMRRPDLAGHLQPMGAVGQIHAVQANLRYPKSLEAACAGTDAVVNLVAILYKSGAQTFERVHIDGARAAARAARLAGAKRFVHVSAIGAGKQSNSVYARTKAAGEAAVREEFPEAVILRPSIVFGPEDQFFNRFAGLARTGPFMPLIGGGRAKVQPVYVGDLAVAIAAAAAGRAKSGTTYEIGGPEVATYRDLLARTQAWAGRRRPNLPIPFWAAKLAALLTVPLPNALRPLTVDQVRLLQRDNIVSAKAREEGRTIEALGVPQPQAMASIVPGYLERFQPKGQYAHYRG
jgi:NADH dehydrogenase